MWENRLDIHVMAGAAIKSGSMSKAFIDVREDGKLNLDFEDGDKEVLTQSELEDIINTEVLDNQPVKVWFMPQTDNSRKISVPVTENMQVKTDEEGFWTAGAFEEQGMVERVNKILKNRHGVYQSGP